MGLGGYLTWTAAIREISNNKIEKDSKIVPCEMIGRTVTKIVESPVFHNNPYVYDKQRDQGKGVFMLPLNLHETNYCKRDTPSKAYHRNDKHIIEQLCEFYGINNPLLKCELYFSKEEKEKANAICSSLSKEYITIEPHSKTSYTVNRKYPLKKWQRIVDKLSKDIQVVQVGRKDLPLMNNVVDCRGKTTFREAALIIDKSKLFLSTEGGLVHAATAVDTKSLVIITGYQSTKMIAYPQNINLNISSHGPCGLKIVCEDCQRDTLNHNEQEIIDKAEQILL